MLIASAMCDLLNKKESLDKIEQSLKYRIQLIIENEQNKMKLKRINDEQILRKLLNGNFLNLTNEEKKSNYFRVYFYLKDFFKKKISKNSFKYIDNFFINGISRIKVALTN